MRVEFAGGHLVAVETEVIVKREAIANTFGSLALILPLLFVVYRSLWLVGIGALPSAFSLALVLGALGFAGARLSSAAAGASAMLFGLGVDGVVLLYVAHLLQPTAADSPERASALGGPAASMLLGMWTTAATFYGLTFVDFPSLQQLGAFIGHSMLACGALTLLLVPALLPRRVPRATSRVLTMPRLAEWTRRHRHAILAAAVVATAALGWAARGLQVDPTLDRLKSASSVAQLGDDIARRFGLRGDVHIVLADGPDLERLLETNERLAGRVRAEMPSLPFQTPANLVPSEAQQVRLTDRIGRAGLTPDGVHASLERAALHEGFKPGTFDPFSARLPRLLDASARLTYEGYVSHGLGDMIERFIVRRGDRWTLVSYFFPAGPADADRLQRIVNDVDPSQTVTGLPLVNSELSRRFLPQFLKGLAIGTLMVTGLVIAAFRSWRLSMLALLPTLVGLVWTAGILALLGAALDLFAIFAVMTFLGIGVDYGIHLVHRYQQHGDGGRATAELAPVIVVAGAITLAGYGTLINSSYPPLRSMGVVSAVSVVALAAASILVLPALLQMGKRA
jgi:predicted RND superfamily exporter protein